MKLFLIRHAEVNNWKKIGFLSYTDLGLSKKGVFQSKKLAIKLKNEKIDEIYSSQLKRSKQTANEIVKYLNLKIYSAPELNEVNFGIFEGLTLEEAERKYSEIFQKRTKNKWNFRIPKGESYKDVQKRVLPFILKVIRNENKNIIVVTHVTIIKILLKSLTDLSLEEIEKYHYYPTSLTVLELQNKKFKPIIINDISHLKKI